MLLENVHFDEARQSQLTALEVLLGMGYQYITADEALRERGGNTSNVILADSAARQLMAINSYEVAGKTYQFTEKEVRDALYELEHLQYEGLIDTAQKVYHTIMPTTGGKTIKVNVGGKTASKNFRFIDFEHPENNLFQVTAEFVVTGKQTIRPDIVCFVNGIPFAVIENKKGSVDVVEAIQQMHRNQGSEFCPKLFTYTQLLVGTNGKELKYGTTGTPHKFYAVWKEKGTNPEDYDKRVAAIIETPVPSGTYAAILTDLNGYTDGHRQRHKRLPTAQDRGLVALLTPARLLDLAKNFILFDAGIKKLSRYQQYFAIHKMLEQVTQIETTDQGITRRKGGLVWHTQGSGKSLTMVMFVKALIEHRDISNPRIIVVTDRRDLDKQIRDTFRNCNLKKEVVQATSGQNLVDLIKEKNLGVITTIIDKFESGKKKVNVIDTDPNIFVLIDEAHRSQNGIAHTSMNTIIPNACYIGFTGTPLMKDEKESWRTFGGYIDKYTIDDALADNIILPLIYEGRYVDLVLYGEPLDRHTERITQHLTSTDKQHLQKQVGVKIIKDNPQRITEIGYDIEKHYTTHFQHTGLKAQIVAPSKYAAVLFQKFFQKQGTIRTAIVISDEHDDGDTENTHKVDVLQYLDSVKKNHSSVTRYEKEVIDSFKYNDDGIEILIVVDKLLTGFDAPRNTVLYLAKDLKDHNLLQAIARVNRLYDNKKLPKTAGYIIDYSENAKNIDTAMKLFGNYDENDVKGTLIDVKEKVQELEQSYSVLQDIFKEVKGSSDDEVFLQQLADAPRREIFYKALSTFTRNLNECFVLQDFVHEFKHLDRYTRELKKFMELRKMASLQYADRIDLSEYKQSLIAILDKYVDAKGVELLTKQINITDRKQFEEAISQLGSESSKAEAIAAQTDKIIHEKMEEDPEFYERFSMKISAVLEKMRQGKLADVAALKQLKLIHDEVLEKKDTEIPQKIASVPGADIFYRNLKETFMAHNVDEVRFEEIIVDIVTIISSNATVDWYKNTERKRQIINSLDDYLYDHLIKEEHMRLSEETMKNIVRITMTLAENNHAIITTT